MLMTWPLRCACGLAVASFAEARSHVLAAECPDNCPESADGANDSMIFAWARKYGWRRDAEPMDPETRKMLDERNNDPAVKEERRRKRRLEAELQRRIASKGKPKQRNLFEGAL
jgi:hypothetical protein